MEFTKRMDRFGAGVFSKLAEIKKERTAKGKKVTDPSMGAPNIPPAPHIMEALYRAAAEFSNYVYAINDGKELLEAIRGWYNTRCGVELDSKAGIYSLLGSQGGLAHIMLSIVGEGNVVLVPDPYYPVFGNGPQIAGARLCYMPQRKGDRYIIRLDEIPGGAARKARLMVVSYPNSPTIAMAPDSFCGELMDFARKCDIIVLHNNAYNDLVFDGRECGSFLRFSGAEEIGMEFNSLSKTYGLTGARVGFCLGDSQVVSRLELLGSNMDCGMFLPVQAAAIATVTGGQSCVQVTRQVYETRKNIICNGFTPIGWKMEQPEAIMSMWTAVPEHYITSEAFIMKLVERASVMVTPGSAFDPSGEGYVCLALAQDEKMFNKAIRAVKESGVLLEGGE